MYPLTPPADRQAERDWGGETGCGRDPAAEPCILLRVMASSGMQGGLNGYTVTVPRERALTGTSHD